MLTATRYMHLRSRDMAPPVLGIRAGTFAVATIFIIVWVISLSRSIFDPIGFDQALYQYITDRVMLGQRLYTDVWDQNTPGIVGIHWLSTVLVGRTPIALRIFDAIWQCATIAALVMLAVRDGRRWQASWLAATLYVLAYYGSGYVHTAQREGFAVLPLLLAVHALAPATRYDCAPRVLALRHVLAGALFFCVFAIKPPLGLCFGVLWLVILVRWLAPLLRPAAQHLQNGVSPLQQLCPGAALGQTVRESRFSIARLSESAERRSLFSLSLGFVVLAALTVALMHHLGWWDGLWRTLTRQNMAGYIRGPQLIRELAPYLLTGAVGIAGIALTTQARKARSRAGATLRPADLAAPLMGGLVVFGLLLTIQRWPEWQQTFFKTAGVLVPAGGAMLLAQWGQRSRIWQMMALLALASLAAILWQGHFALYQFPPLLACAAYVAAVEIVERFPRFCEMDKAGRVWTLVCLGAVIYLATGTWGWTMIFYGRAPYILSGTTLTQHYTKVTANKPSFPTYETTSAAAARVRELTRTNDPIVCLVDEPRLYYLAQRPPAYPLLRTQVCYSNMFPALFEAIRTQHPKVLLARLPAGLRGNGDVKAAEAAVLADLESYFGPPARVVREEYTLAEVVNGDLCILQPKARINSNADR
ncbi:MAG: hypothetical protein ACUVXJ_10590 [Phycisphaerae bacterium]